MDNLKKVVAWVGVELFDPIVNAELMLSLALAYEASAYSPSGYRSPG